MGDQYIWIAHPKLCWVAAKVKDAQSYSTLVTIVDGHDMRVNGNISKYESVDIELIKTVVENLAELKTTKPVGEGLYMHHIRARFLAGSNYTWIGQNLIAVNTYSSKMLSVEDIDKITAGFDGGAAKQPHIVTAAVRAIRMISFTGTSQALVLSGISGSGKTYCARQILASTAHYTTKHSATARPAVEKLLQSVYAVLESLGNCKTNFNFDSSRYGSSFEVHFDVHQHFSGLRIRPFYLDTSPAVKVGKGDRSFHIFYMMLSGIPEELRADLKLGPVTMFQTLSQSGYFLIPGRADAENYEKFVEALNTFEINPTIQLQILKVLAAILWLGNINFIMRGKGAQMGCSVVNDDDLFAAAELLSVESSDLRRALCYKAFGNTEVLMEAMEATMAKNLLVRVLYHRLFMFVIQSMNARIYRGSFGASLSVIDHPGFECLPEGNSLEQLHINYCDEKLRRVFTDHTFERELKVYEAEGVFCGEIVIKDSLKSVKLVDSKRSGIFMIMDRESSLGSVLKDDSLLSKMTTAYMHTNLTKNNQYNQIDTRTPFFTIRHYTGEVTYSVQGFMNKNVADLSPNTVNYLKNSRSPLFKNILAFGNRKSSGAVVGQSTELSRKLEGTISNLQSSKCTFVHCIKSNNSFERDAFDSTSILQQLKSLEITAQVQIRKLGYVVHISHHSFLQRYARCVDLLQMKKIPVVLSSSIGDPFECTSVLEYLSIKLNFQNIEGTTSNWLVGATCVLLKSESILEALDICRMNVCAQFVVKVQKAIRGYILRNIIMPKKHGNHYDSKIRMKTEQKLMAHEDILSKQYDVVMNQLAMLEETARQKLLSEKRAREKVEKDRVDLKLFHAAVTIQKRIRGILTRHRVLIKRCANELNSAIALHDEAKLRSALEYVEGLKVKSSQLAKLKNVAKNVLLAAHSDSYVSMQLKEAISSSSVTILSDAIRLAENAKCTQIPEYSEALTALAEISTRRNLILLLSSELERSTSVAELVSRADKIERLIRRMVDTGLAAETVVMEAHQRIQRIQNLLTVRNSIRAAVELCCVSDIDAAMSRRDEMIALYGENLFISEAAAVVSMKRLLKLEACLYEGFEERDPTLPRLPKFIRNLLDTMKAPQTATQADEARDRLLLLVPVQEDMQAYMRVFKWIVAICVWRYPREQSEPIGVLQLTTQPKSGVIAPSTIGKSYAASEYTTKTKKTAATTATQRSSSDKANFSSKRSKAEIIAYLALKKSTNESDALMASSLKVRTPSAADTQLLNSVSKYSKFYRENPKTAGWH